MAVAGIIGAVVAAAAAAYSAYASSQAQAQANQYQAKLYKNQSINAANAAEVEIQNRREHYRRQMAAQRAAIGASGIEGNEGSPLLLETDSAEQAALDLARVRYAGQIRVTNYQAEENLNKFAARSVRQQGYISAGASLLQGAAGAYGAYAKGQSGGSVSTPS